MTTRTRDGLRDAPTPPPSPTHPSGPVPAPLVAPPANGDRPPAPNGIDRLDGESTVPAPDGVTTSTTLPAAGVPSPSPSEPPRRSRITFEGGLYVLFVGLAILTRFWDLGSRTLHHDESLHAYFSWLLATGGGYTHNPLMHGPFLFHFGALVFALFGATDALSRAPMALCGVILVALPYLLRGPRLLGRWGALAASFLLLISPALLYQSRYLRHDTYTVAGTLVLFIAVVRYVERPERRWLVTIGASLGFLLTNHEIVFGLAFLFAAAIGGALLWGRLRPIAPIVAATAAIGYALVKWLPEATGRPLPAIPWSGPTAEQQQQFYRDLLSNPLTIAVVFLLLVATAAASVVLARVYRDRGAGDPSTDGSPADEAPVRRGWVDRILGDGPPGSVQEAVRAAWADRAGLSVAAVVGTVIFVVFFTTLFTNLYGLATGTIATDGTLLYWLGQHDYQRGKQPWFYFLLLWPQYEYIAVLFGGAATVVVGVRALRVAFGRPAGPRFFPQMLLAVWFIGIFAALSWAGEKMPWLVIHITLPATLLAGMLIGEVAERWVAGDGRRQTADGSKSVRPGVWRLPSGNSSAVWSWPEWGLTALLLGLGAGWVLLAARLTYGTFVSGTEAGGWDRVLTDEAVARWWLLAVPPLLGLVGLVALTVRRGVRRGGQVPVVAVLAGLALLQVHAGWRLTYREGDVPKDMLVYTQTAPDMKRMFDEIAVLSRELTGGNDLEVWYDNNKGVSWPTQWYLRDYPNGRLYGGGLSGPPEGSPPVLLVGDENKGRVDPFMDGYTAQTYVLRWWFPESIYRNFAIAPEIPAKDSAWGDQSNPSGPLAILGSIGDSLGELSRPEGQARLFRLVVFRDLPTRIQSTNYTMYVRNDLVPLLNTIRY